VFTGSQGLWSRARRLKDGGPPRVKLRRGLRHEPTADGALARAPRGHDWRQRLETAGILPRGDADEHLFDHAPIQRIFIRHRLKRRQRHLGTVGSDAWPTNRDFPPAQYDLARHGAGARGLARVLMLIPTTAQGRSILFQHRREHLQAGGDSELHQLGPCVHEQIDKREMTLGW
jgi:hypothetical protein